MRNHQLKIRNGMITLLVAQAAILCTLSVICIYMFYNQYVDLLYKQTSQTVDLYRTSVETKMAEIEKLSYSIMADMDFQEQCKIIKDPYSYEVFSARNYMEKILMNYLFTTREAQTIRYVSRDGIQLFGSYQRHLENFSKEKMEQCRALGEVSNGGAIWSFDTAQNTLECVRSIRNISSGYFETMGILVISCPMSEIFYHRFNSAMESEPFFVISSGGQALYSSSPLIPSADLAPQDGGEAYSLVKIDDTVYCRAVQTSAATKWNYACYFSRDDILRHINLLNSRIVLIFILVTAVALFFCAEFAFSISKPIERLCRKMKKVNEGRYELIAESDTPRYRISEVGELNSTYNVMINEIDTLIHDVYEKQLMIKDMRYQILQSQISPHFLYNTLATVDAMAKRDGNAQIAQIARSLSALLRSSLSERDVIPLTLELHLLRSYVAIQQIRFEERLQFTVTGEEEIQGAVIPKLTLQPLVENAINYGLEKFSRVCFIQLRFHREEGVLVITVEDNGPGMEEDFIRKIFSGEIVPQRTGLGVKNVNERIRFTFGESFGLSFESGRESGTAAVIRIPDGRDGHVPADHRG